MFIIDAFGGGTNSTAMLVGQYERGIVPTGIWFADTGGEKPETYRHINEVSEWCESVGFPRIEVLRGEKYWGPQMVKDGSLENECLRLGVMPAKAYGHSSCSQKWKLEPGNRRLKQFIVERGISYSDVTRCVGFDAGEPTRVERAIEISKRKPKDYREVYPLYDWGWDREDCIAAITRAGIGLPGKSSCFFCPSMRKVEILQLRKDHPDLLSRALEIERKARCDEGEGLSTPAIGGLGRALIWKNFIDAVEFDDEITCGGIRLGSEPVEMDCGCFDGD